jgi:membrane fusion protein, multidrug efflux system
MHLRPAMRALWTSIAALALLGACKKSDDVAAKEPPAAVKLPLVVASEAPTPDQLTLTGMITADQRAEVTADTQGKVISVMVERGQRVKMGAAVVQLDVRTAALSAREAQANVESARAQRKLAEEECKRAQTLLDQGAITRSEYDRQTTQCTSALQQVSAAEARAAMMSKSVADGIVRAPFDGIVTQKSVNAGEWVSPGKPLFTLVDDEPLRIELSVPEAAVRAVKEKQPVELVAVAQPDKTYSATVTRVGAEIGRTRSLIVEATLDPTKDLVPGMFAEAHVTIGQTTRPVLPKEAVAKRGKTWHAFVDVKGELQDRIVQLGPAPSPTQVSIVQGVAKGDKVVAKVTDQVVDGLRVQE